MGRPTVDCFGEVGDLRRARAPTLTLCAGLPTPHDPDRMSPKSPSGDRCDWRPAVDCFGEVGDLRRARTCAERV